MGRTRISLRSLVLLAGGLGRDRAQLRRAGIGGREYRI
jgi:hypothetical protein